jgi:hypothetical protein
VHHVGGGFPTAPNIVPFVNFSYLLLLCRAGGAPLSAAGRAIDRIAVDLPRVLRAAGIKTDLRTVQLAGDWRSRVAILERAADRLKSLFERQLAVRELPRAFYFRRDDPQMRRAPVRASFDRGGFVVFPIFHIEGVRDDTRTGL